MDLMQNIEIPDWGGAIQKLSNRIHSDLDGVKRDISIKQNKIEFKEANDSLSERITLLESRNAEMIESIIKIQKNDNYNHSIKSDNIEYYDGIDNIDQNELEIMVSAKTITDKKQNCIKIQEGNTDEIEYSHSNNTHKQHDSNVVKMTSAEEKESKMYSEKYALNKEQLKVYQN